MRKTRYQPVRTSSDDWRRWAADHGAYVLEDDVVGLDERCAIHELAKLNIGVSSGPMVLSEYSVHRSYIALKMLAGEISSNEGFYHWQGWFPGDQFPWAGKHQCLVWNDRDDYESIENAYQAWAANNPPQELAESAI
jgi:hypothetical protein